MNVAFERRSHLERSADNVVVSHDRITIVWAKWWPVIGGLDPADQVLPIGLSSEHEGDVGVCRLVRKNLPSEVHEGSAIVVGDLQRETVLLVVESARFFADEFAGTEQRWFAGTFGRDTYFA